jgi:hypothetical protein
MEKFSDNIGNITCDPLACSKLPQPPLLQQLFKLKRSKPVVEVIYIYIRVTTYHTHPCGGGLEYLHRSPCES